MSVSGIALKGAKTKELVKRLGPENIAVINHQDIDRVSADSLVACRVKAVINVAASISGRYPNLGPQIVVDAGILLIDNVGPELFAKVNNGDELHISDSGEISSGSQILGTGTVLDAARVALELTAAELAMDSELEQFVQNTVTYLDEQSVALIYDPWVPSIRSNIHGRHVLVVVRGYDYQEDLRALRPYIREVRPVLIGVDGGADAILEAGFQPDIIIGDMDSVSDQALLSGAEVIPHAYANGSCPSARRLESLGIKAESWPLAATSEDLALLLAWEKKADLIVALGTHSNLVEYLDKGRSGMASSFLVRLKVGTRLVDAKGVSKLYRAAPPSWQVLIMLLAALAVVIVIFSLSAPLRDSFNLLWLNIRASLGI
ncbi:MAG: hypothetical protein LBU07_06685 [Coriobacteriales bacterium]|jgi:uncharacterized membrane-anchored protein|nr:hypothetical protein [Coriobacteriales bacterium]